MRDFLKYTFASFVGLLLFCTLGIAGLAFLLVAIATATRDTGPMVENDTVLTVDLSLNITDSRPSRDASELVGTALTAGEVPPSISLRSVLDAIDYAATDDRIVGLYLYGNINPVASGSGLATLQEVRRALQEFQSTGKPIYAYALTGSERDYYLTSIADTLVLNPTGLLEFNGFSSETQFFAEALDKYGIGVQVIRAGQYKAAVEPFTRTESSPENQEQTQQLLTDLWTEFLSTVSDSRDVTPQQLQAIADTEGLLLPDQAQSSGLVDDVAYEDELLTELKTLTGESEEDDRLFRQISLPEYASVADETTSSPGSENLIAIIYAEGDIVSGSGGTGFVGSDRLSGELKRLREDESVKAIVLRINSPGGSATASDVIAREVLLTREEKPVIVSMGSLAASGGYLIATNADRIFASPTTITGSIGVFGLLPNIQELANNNGITTDVVKTAPFADSDSLFRPKTAQELAIGQRVVDQLYDQFLERVVSSRPISRQEVASVAQGHVWSGVAAKRLGLVDELGGLEAAIESAARQAELGDDWVIQEYPEYRSLGQQILENLLGSRMAASAPPLDPLSLELQKLKDDLLTLKAMNDPLGAYTRLPFTPRID